LLQIQAINSPLRHGARRGPRKRARSSDSAPVAARFLPAEATAPRWTVHGCILVRDGKFAVKTLNDAGGKTTGYSRNGSSSHAALLALLERHKVDAGPVSRAVIPPR
jgi:ABC-type nitrate/sulfonate/bicarbonate transport system substrate-binding protein